MEARRWARWADWLPLLFVFALVLFASAILTTPNATLQSFLAKARRAEDVTPERLARLKDWSLLVLVACAPAILLLSTFPYASTFVLHGLAAIPSRLREFVRPACSPTLLSLIVLGTGIRLAYLNGPMDYDESYSYLNYARQSWIEALSNYNNTNNHLLNTLLIRAQTLIFGSAPWAIRLHVCLAGVMVLMLTPAWIKARFPGLNPLLPTALVAVSPILVFYSVNARGYMLVILFSQLLDLSLLHLGKQLADRQIDSLQLFFTDPCSASLSMLTVLAGVLGFFAMPIFVYPAGIAATLFLLSPISADKAPTLRLPIKSLLHRVGYLMLIYYAIGLTVLLLYGPAYVFRGLEAFRNKFVQPLAREQWLIETPKAWEAAMRSWSLGMMPDLLGTSVDLALVLLPFAVSLLIVAGMLILGWNRLTRYSAFVPIVVTLMLMSAQRVAPPERVFIFLAPWGYACLSAFITSAFQLMVRLARQVHPEPIADRLINVVAAGICIAGCWNTTVRGVYYPHSDHFYLPGIANLVAMIEHDPNHPENAINVLAPLPTDLPVLYYAHRRGLKVQLNQPVSANQASWLISRDEYSPAEESAAILHQDGLLPTEIRDENWALIGKSARLTLWRSRRLADR